jgi:XPG N-terminal domain
LNEKLISSTGTVNGLESFIEKNLIRTAPINDLENCALGVDAAHFIRTIYSRDSVKSSLSSALGGIPAAFRTEVEKDLAQFEKMKTNLRFVFDGLDLYNFNLKDDKTMRVDPFVAKRKSAWDAWTKLAEKGRYADAKDREDLANQTHEAFNAGIPLLFYD